MTKRQSGQGLDDEVMEGLRRADPQALVEQKLVSAQNYVVGQRAAYTKALMHRAQCIALAHAAGWSKYRIAKRLGITRRAVDEALERPELSPAEFLATQVAANGGHEDLSTRRLQELLSRKDSEMTSRREMEDQILAEAANLDSNDHSAAAERTRELAESIEGHRSAAEYRARLDAEQNGR